MPSKAKKAKKGSFIVPGLKAYIDGKIKEVQRALKALKPKSKPKPNSPAKPAPVLIKLAENHRKRAQLLKAGRAKDQLMRALIPLYLGQGKGLLISSGVTNKFWGHFKVTFAAPNAAKALRTHPGHSKRTQAGPSITAKGIAYVEAAFL